VNPRLTSALVVVLLGAGALAGCAATPELNADAAKGLQTSVQTVASHAAAGDSAAAVTALDALQAQLDEAVANDEISDDRATAVQAKIDLVRADLVQRIADAEAAAAAEAQRIAAEQAEAARVAEAQRVAAEQQAEADRLAQEKAAKDARDARDDKGKGNDKNDDDEE
jgi:ribosomal protein S20